MLFSQFSILGGRNSTRALQYTPFQNPGGGFPERDTVAVAVVAGVGEVAGQYFPFLILGLTDTPTQLEER